MICHYWRVSILSDMLFTPRRPKGFCYLGISMLIPCNSDVYELKDKHEMHNIISKFRV